MHDGKIEADTTVSLDEFQPVTNHVQAPLWIYPQALEHPPELAGRLTLPGDLFRR
jgi:hypothetical protein